MTLTYKTQTISKEDIYSHLKQCDDSFTPPLSLRVNLLDYSNKIFERSVSFEAWEECVLVGMLNAYFNNTDNQAGFITNVSILRAYRGKGVAHTLLKMCLAYARKHDFSRVNLDVSKENAPAIRLYSTAGFQIIRESEDSLLMEYKLTITSNENVRDT